MKKLADMLISEKFVVTVIVINAIVLFMIGFTDEWEQTQAWTLFFSIDYACVIYFVMEAGIKITKAGWKIYWKDHWNRFDFTVVVLSLPMLLSPMVETNLLGGLPVLRLGRLFRLFRLLRFIPNRDHLVKGINRALKASVGVLLALFLIIIILSIGATFLFQDKAPEYFGNPLLSCYSIFKVCTIEGWYEIPDRMAQNAAEEDRALLVVFSRIYFIFSVIVMGIIGLSLANAIFIDEMTVDNTRILEDKVDVLQAEIRALRDEIRATRNDTP
jgi:voltage-gated sodium channel